MSLQAILGPYASELLEARTLEELKQTLYSIFTSAAPIDVRTPLKINNHMNQEAIQIVNTGRDTQYGISVKDSDGRETTLGIGLGSSGIMASEIVPNKNFTLDPSIVAQHFNGQNVGSGLGVGVSGSGVPNTIINYEVKPGWGSLLDSYLKSPQTWHPAATADQFSMNGVRKWWPTDPVGWTVIRCRITAVNNDTLTCVVIDDGSGSDPQGIIGSTVTVAKDCHLQRTPWDGQTIGGVTYTYSDSQTRTANDGVTTEDQVVYPKYRVDGDSYDPCSCVYARWVANRTDLSGTWYIDLNTAARHWVVA